MHPWLHDNDRNNVLHVSPMFSQGILMWYWCISCDDWKYVTQTDSLMEGPFVTP